MKIILAYAAGLATAVALHAAAPYIRAKIETIDLDVAWDAFNEVGADE